MSFIVVFKREGGIKNGRRKPNPKGKGQKDSDIKSWSNLMCFINFLVPRTL